MEETHDGREPNQEAVKHKESTMDALDRLEAEVKRRRKEHYLFAIRFNSPSTDYWMACGKCAAFDDILALIAAERRKEAKLNAEAQSADEP